MTVTIRPEEPLDRPAALEVERLAFASDEEPAVIEAVRDEVGSFALIAEDEGEVVGHIQFSRAWIGATPVSALGPIGVRPDRQGRGIGSALVRSGLEEAARRGETIVILLGSPSFYPRFGFEPALRRGLRNPFAGIGEGDFVIAEEDCMLCELGEGPSELAGEVSWHPAFGQVG